MLLSSFNLSLLQIVGFSGLVSSHQASPKQFKVGKSHSAEAIFQNEYRLPKMIANVINIFFIIPL
jgi:hypothetical protein